ncbi:MAG TPA: secretin N-terminal domain-containing protein [Verrucomicrobiae bacterium]|jgi:type II secretory pathway component GspD/PulD (secretin)
MNAKKNVVAITLGLALTHLAFAQNSNSLFEPASPVQTNLATASDTDAGTTNQVVETVSNQPPDVAMTNQTVTPPEDTNVTVTTVSSNVTTVVSNEVTTTANEPSGVSKTNSTSEVTSTETTSNTAVIPLIQFQDVPITTAIENLARQANINYLLDPKINYGQPDEKGQAIPEPTLSIRWENVTAEQALLALLDNYNLQLIQDPKTKIGRITVKEPGALPPLITRVVQLKYTSVSNMEVAVENTFTDKRSKVVADNRTSQLVVVATDREQTAVDTLIDELDKPTKQVLIETRLMEVSSNPSTAKGMDWAGTLAAQNISFGNNALPSLAPQAAIPASAGPPPTLAQPATQGVIGGVLNSGPGLLANTANGLNPSTMFLNADGVKAVLSFLNQDSDAQVIATPRVVTLDNETAHIEVTRGVPIFNNTAGTQGSPGGSTVTYTNLGTILDVTPHISANDYISLLVAPEVSDVFDTVTRTVAGQVSQADEYDSRRVTTQVLIPNSNTLVMGGFIKDNTKNIYTKVPFMGDVPVLGLAFRHESKSLDKDNLLIFITPTIVRDTDFQPTTTGFLKSSPMAPAKPMNAQTAWNSAKPHDWSNPRNTDPYLKAIDQNAAESQ